MKGTFISSEVGLHTVSQAMQLSFGMGMRMGKQLGIFHGTMPTPFSRSELSPMAGKFFAMTVTGGGTRLAIVTRI